MDLTRRDFLQLGAAGAGVFCFGPSLWAAARDAVGPALDNDHVLVLLQLSGGNDGLSTVVPFADDAYGRSRTSTRIAEKGLLKLNDHVGLHPNLGGLKEIWDAGSLAIVQGTGYPDPNRSHFKSMDIWHAADPRGRGAGYGWIGRLADTAYAGSTDPSLVVHVGDRVPYALHAAVHRPIAFTAPQAYRWIGAKSEVEALESAGALCEGMDEGAADATGPHRGRDSALARMRRVLIEAQRSSEKVREAAASYRPQAVYPNNPLAGSLATVAALLAGGLGTRIYSVETGGYDTHQGQKNRHDGLMATLGASLGAFWKDLRAQKLDERVTLVAFSEFGRRVKENASGGTDHGVAGPMFVIGSSVKGGLYGKHPSLTELDRGDLIHTTDFRRVYSTVIDRWIGGNHRDALGKKWEALGFMA